MDLHYVHSNIRQPFGNVTFARYLETSSHILKYSLASLNHLRATEYKLKDDESLVFRDELNFIGESGFNLFLSCKSDQ